MAGKAGDDADFRKAVREDKKAGISLLPLTALPGEREGSSSREPDHGGTPPETPDGDRIHGLDTPAELLARSQALVPGEREELLRLRATLCDVFQGENASGTTFKSLSDYFLEWGLKARAGR